MFLHSLFLVVLKVTAVFATNPGVAFEQDNSLPLLRLPYGTWRASQYNKDADVYTFRNIRYGAPPVGELRWARPAPPKYTHGIQDGSYGPNCIPIALPGSEGDHMSENTTTKADEDCLFLDAYVPRKVLRKHKRNTPVVVWIHGGGFTVGSKDTDLGMGYYDGTGLIQQADHDLIVITINYRLGGFGFLAGEPLRTAGTFHAGLHDQRAALAWVQSYIHLLGGDPDNVSAWGQSAGAGSIMYHLVAEGGTLDPLFQRAFVQSPGFASGMDMEYQYERFQNFTALAGCEDAGSHVMDCLRAVDASVLTEVNKQVFSWEASPVPDGMYIQSTADVELAKGNYWKYLDSLMISNVLDEGSILVPQPIPPNQLENNIYFHFPSRAYHLAQEMVDFYRRRYANSPPAEMITDMTRDLTITCHQRTLSEAYAKITWATQYSYLDGVLNGVHASESVAQWYNPQLSNRTEPLFAEYQRYITNHARSGNPNNNNHPGPKATGLLNWPKIEGIEREEMGNVLNMTNAGFELTDGDQMLRSTCGTWTKLLVEAASMSG
ncbi:hypothetical protein FE257_010678 [Aspergillus nanangensis]|uniref:Carboxylesterase type B domain-containing protein n=1 Tax=Aspergillus nanangensis TaxID=2582783 RepID=A0AAD4CJV7_ASPNN|nr:hypothetical protein FE257_010678 [Aspergillus nanangensis]